jgi:hypothetical protein
LSASASSETPPNPETKTEGESKIIHNWQKKNGRVRTPDFRSAFAAFIDSAVRKAGATPTETRSLKSQSYCTLGSILPSRAARSSWAMHVGAPKSGRFRTGDAGVKWAAACLLEPNKPSLSENGEVTLVTDGEDMVGDTTGEGEALLHGECECGWLSLHTRRLTYTQTRTHSP